MKLISWNVNGIRAAHRKGFGQWLEAQQADIVCLQEIKARPHQLEPDVRNPPGYHAYWYPAQKPGYSGVALFSRREPFSLQRGMGVPEFDREGRILLARYPGFTLLNIYFPHARRDLTRLDFKLRFCEAVLEWVRCLQGEGNSLIVCGDYNIAHRDIDLANPGPNRKNAGFLPEEKAWMDRFLAAGFHDVFREKYPERNGHYTWWSFQKGVRERNVGWRIDYHCVARALLRRVKAAGHQPLVGGSDHCPVYLELCS